MGKILQTEVENPDHLHGIAVSMGILVTYLLVCLLVFYFILFYLLVWGLSMEP